MGSVIVLSVISSRMMRFHVALHRALVYTVGEISWFFEEWDC